MKQTPVSFSLEVEKEYPGTILLLSNFHQDYVMIHLVKVPNSLQRCGIGTAILSSLIAVADTNGWNLALTPDDCYGTPLDVLKKFYGKFGFDANSSYEELMIRKAKNLLDT
jgi:hypothetical protein